MKLKIVFVSFLIFCFVSSSSSNVLAKWEGVEPFPSHQDPLHFKWKTYGRPPPNQRKFQSVIIDEIIANYTKRMKDPELAQLFENCLPNTLDTTIDYTPPSSNDPFPDTFVITGDIDAMWLRDSTNQVLPYVEFASKDEKLAKMLQGVLFRQVKSILIDPYANAFYKEIKNSPHSGDMTYKYGFLGTRMDAMNFHIHERKYELDSICSFLKLSNALYQSLHRLDLYGEEWKHAVDVVLQVMEEQQGGSDAPNSYFFQRNTNTPTDTLMFGVGAPCVSTGMIKSSFRPSDDANTFPFSIPSNAFALASLNQLAVLLQDLKEFSLLNRTKVLANGIQTGIAKYGLRKHAIVEKEVYSYEVDGYGNSYFMDDANIPSLLSLPYLGYTSKNDPTYLNTRELVWSKWNPYFFHGNAGEGIGGPHNGLGWIWPMSIMMKAITSQSDQEILDLLELLKKSSAGTGYMHESFWKDDASSYTRPWFAWANSLFGELILTLAKEHPQLIFK